MRLIDHIRSSDAAEIELFSSARQLGVSAKVIRNQLKTWRMNVKKTATGELFVPKAGLIKLVKVMDTPECWAAYNQLWDDAHELARLRPQIEMKDRKIAELEAQVARLSAIDREV